MDVRWRRAAVFKFWAVSFLGCINIAVSCMAVRVYILSVSKCVSITLF